jgi:hypothetical protein
MNKTITAPIAVVLIIIFAAGGFYGGMQYQKKQSPSIGNFAGGQPGQFGGAAGRAGRTAGANRGGSVSGDILKLDASSITVSINGGGSKIVYLSASSSIGKFVEGTVADLKIGERVMVNGAPNSDGSIVAQMIQIRSAALPGGQAGTGLQGGPSGQNNARIGGPGSMPTSGPINNNGQDKPVQPAK